VFLPGMGQSAHFTKEHRVLALTTRGVGESGRPAQGYGTRELMEDLRNFLDALEIRRAILAGHSLAGNELTAFALAHPEQMEKLIYIQAAYDFSRMPQPGEDPVVIEKPSVADLADLPAGMRWFERVFGFSSPAVEADVRDVNLAPDGTMRAESMPREIGKQLWEGMVAYKPATAASRGRFWRCTRLSNASVSTGWRRAGTTGEGKRILAHDMDSIPEAAALAVVGGRRPGANCDPAEHPSSLLHSPER
jgi:pimeloyl-ACP methyl ester carboxylesterase